MKLIFRGKVWRRLGYGLAISASVAVIATLAPVDYSPYFNTDYYKRTITQASEPFSNSVVTGELQAGFGRALLTPSFEVHPGSKAQFHSVPLAGYGGRKSKPATGVHDDVYVKAVAFKVNDRVGIIIGADALIIPREVAERAMEQLQKESGLTREQVYFGATHTHSSLGGWGQGIVAESFAGRYDEALSKWFSATLVTAIQTALADLKPAALGTGSFPAPEFLRNRLVGRIGAVDPEFRFEVVKQTGEGRLAIIGSFGAHATVLSAANMQFSADYPGYWQRALEQSTSGMALFLAGGVGSHSPVPGASGFEGAEKMGKRLADLVNQHLSQVTLTNVVSFGVRSLTVALPPLHARLADQLRLRPWVAKQLLPVSDQTLLQAFRLNNIVWISTPCDFSGELALGIKEFARAKGFECTVTSFNGDYIGYVIPARYYHLSGYEPRLMSFYGPTISDYLEDLARRLAVDLWN